mgnify:CR=1 FL=1|jgi:UDPglucose 6-dehydrogenase
MKISVAGAGYVGLVTAVCLAEVGHDVTCVDIDEHKINMLKIGKSPIFEEGLEDLMFKNQERLSYTTNSSASYKNPDVIIIAVGTPEKRDGSANLTFVYEVAHKIAANVERDCVVVIKSTVPIGTNDKIETMIKENLRHEVRIEVVSNPEFLAQGSAINDTLNASRIVIGAESDNARNILINVYEAFNQPMVVTDRRSAEMIKYASNDFLALKISYINEIANLCEIVGANIQDVAYGMGLDPRIGNMFLQAGVGYGGSCFPKDTKALHWLANFFDYELKTIKAAIEVNENQKLKLIKKARKYYDSFSGLNIAVLGLTFKPNTDDLRDAPSLVNIPLFLDDGANIRAYDPVGQKNYQKIYPTQINYCKSIDETIQGADICFIFTEWNTIKNYDVSKYARLMRNPIILDGRNCYSIEQMEKINVIYESIGRIVVRGNTESFKEE